MLSFPRVFGNVGAALLLAACATAPAPAPDAPPTAAALSAPRTGEGRVYRLDAQGSAIRIHVFRSGAAARLGHNHVMAAADISGYVQVPDARGDAASFALEFRLDAMQVDPPELRQALGAGWSTAVSAEAIAGTRANMLGEAGLQADRYPLVRIRSLQVSGEAPKLAVQVDIELHGQHQRQWLPLVVDIGDGSIKAGGSAVIRQSDFGLKPFSVLGGLLSVKDELVIDFELSASAER